jgi:hypothetical protein
MSKTIPVVLAQAKNGSLLVAELTISKNYNKESKEWSTSYIAQNMDFVNEDKFLIPMRDRKTNKVIKISEKNIPEFKGGNLMFNPKTNKPIIIS